MFRIRLSGRVLVLIVCSVVLLAGSVVALRSTGFRSKVIAAPAPNRCLQTLANAPTVSDAPSVEFIAAALRNQESAVIEVKYSESEFGVSAEPAIDWLKTHYIRTPEVLWATQTWMVSSREVREASYDFSTRENRRLTTLQDGSHIGRVETEVSEPFTNLDLVDPVRYPLYWYWSEEGPRPLSGWVLQGRVLPEQEDIDGHRCWRVDVVEPLPGLEKYSIWLDSTIGFCPRRVDVISADRTIVARFQDYRELAGGIWFPMKQVNEGDAGDSRKYTSVMTVSEVNAGKTFSKESLLVKFPSGTKLYVGATSTTSVTVP